MPSASLRNLDVDGLLALRAEVEKALAERAHDLETQLRLAPKYRGPNGEAWAGRGATHWLAALSKKDTRPKNF